MKTERWVLDKPSPVTLAGDRRLARRGVHCSCQTIMSDADIYGVESRIGHAWDERGRSSDSDHPQISETLKIIIALSFLKFRSAPGLFRFDMHGAATPEREL